jgi:hypothetical protein
MPMSVAEIKNDLHKLVVNTENETILGYIRSYFLELVNEEDWWDKLSDKQKRQIQDSEAQIADGKTVTHQTVREKVKLLLAQK